MIHEIIQNRKSSVLFSDRKIDNSLIMELFKAARLAPSSNNIQPWRFIYGVNGEKEFENLFVCLSEKNKEWAKHASVLLLTVAYTMNDHTQRENRYALHDTGMAYANLAFQAVSLGLSIHPMGGFDQELAVKNAQLPPGHVPVIMAAIGYKSTPENFPQHLVDRENRPRIRKPLNEIVFHGKFMNSSGL